MKKIYLVACIISISALNSCKKYEGLGGSSQITGKITGVDLLTLPRAEVTNVTCFNNADPQSGLPIYTKGYFLLNTMNGAGYYVYFGANPNVLGRTGIPVSVANGASGVSVANSMILAINSIAGADLTATAYANSSDIVVITNIKVGNVPDAADGVVKAKIDIDIAVQGKLISLSTEGALRNIDVYIVYGNDAIYGDKFKTDNDGHYWFKGLTKGAYKIYTYTTDISNGSQVLVERSVTIVKNKENVVVADFSIIH